MSYISYNYKIEQSLSVATHTFKWEIISFKDVLLNTNISEFRTNMPSINSRPQLKMAREENDIAVSFIFPTRVRLTYNTKVGKNQFLLDHNVTIEANVWHCFLKFNKIDIINNSPQYFNVRNNKYSDNLELCITLKIKLEDAKSEKYDEFKCSFENALKTGLFSDAILKSVDGKEYKVHKVILGCRSAVFKAHFEHDTTESRTNIVKVPFESEVIEEVLYYIYSNEVSRVEDIAGKMLAAADFYQLNDLKSFCANELSKQLSIENVLDTLELAELYGEDSLKESALNFIEDGNLKFIIQTHSWKNIKSVELMKSICEHISPKADKNIVYVNEVKSLRNYF